MGSNLERRRRILDDVNGGYLPEDLVLSARREEIEWAHSEVAYEIVPMQECKDADKKLLELTWVDTDKSVESLAIKFDRDCVPGNTRRKKQGKIQRTIFASQLFSAMSPLEAVEALVSIMMSVSWLSKRKSSKLRHHDIGRTYFQGTAQRLIYIRLPAKDRQKLWQKHSWQIDQEHVWNIWQDASHIEHSAALSHNSNEDVRVAVHGDVFVCLSDDDGLNYIDKLLKSKYTAKDMGTLGFDDSDVKSLLLLNRVFRVGQNLDIEPDLRHAPLIINESGCNANTKTLSTPRTNKTSWC